MWSPSKVIGKSRASDDHKPIMVGPDHKKSQINALDSSRGNRKPRTNVKTKNAKTKIIDLDKSSVPKSRSLKNTRLQKVDDNSSSLESRSKIQASPRRNNSKKLVEAEQKSSSLDDSRNSDEPKNSTEPFELTDLVDLVKNIPKKYMDLFKMASKVERKDSSSDWKDDKLNLDDVRKSLDQQFQRKSLESSPPQVRWIVYI